MASFQSQTRRLLPRNINVPATYNAVRVFQSQTRRLLPRNTATAIPSCIWRMVSIADATLASPQQHGKSPLHLACTSFNRRRDACFPATHHNRLVARLKESFNRRRDACFPATREMQEQSSPEATVSIADAT